MNASNKNITIVVLVAIVIGLGVFALRMNKTNAPEEPMTNTNSQTNTNSKPITLPEEPNPLIRVTTPTKNQTITSPVSITGQARGQWYFEATFPIEVTDANGKTIGTGYATAQGEWMTTEFVPFTSKLTFTKPATTTGFIVLKKSNASGLPENDASISLPVTF